MSSPVVSRPALVSALAPDEWPEHVPVLIIGGGPVGLSAAILLAQHGIEPFLVERRSAESRFPRAHLLNVRTMEIFAEMGVADDIYALAPMDERWRKVVWYTSVSGPTPLHGLKLGEVPAWGGGSDTERYAEASNRRFTNLPQIHLDPLLWAHAEACCPGRVRAFQELTGLEQHPDGGVTATIVDRVSGAEHRVRADYAIGADGGRTSADLLGIEREGPTAIQDVVSFYVSADLSEWSEPDALLAHFVQPYGEGRLVGTLQALGPRTYGRNSPEWLVVVSPRRDASGRPVPVGDDDDPLDRARQMLGLAPDHPMTMHSVSHWQYEGVVARRFRSGSAFLAGDAAHRHPPTGGLGLNGGVQDAHNLAWKLAAVLHGQGGDGLLDSYEAERRLIAAQNTAHALENAGRHAPIGAALGLGPGIDDEQGWAEIEAYMSDTPVGEKRRAMVAEAVAENSNDYSQLGVEAGFVYTVGAMVDDGAPSPGAASPVDYRPSTRPGHHLPHVWLALGRDHPVSTLDLVETSGMTLFTGPAEADGWRAAAAALRPAPGCDAVTPVTVVPVPDEESAWVAVRGVDAGGAVLARPDRKVAWRTRESPADLSKALQEVIDTVLGGGTDAAVAATAAAPHLERIHRAAERLGR